MTTALNTYAISGMPATAGIANNPYAHKTRADFVDDLRQSPDMLRVYTAACQEIALNCWLPIYDAVGNSYAVNDVIASYAVPFTYQWRDTLAADPCADIYPALNALITLVESAYPAASAA